MRECRKELRRAERARAFSVIELLVVIGIIGILAGLLLPAVQNARESARKMHCVSNLKQVAIGLHLHHDAYGRVPPRSSTGGPNDPNQLLLWPALILPQMEQHALWETSTEACRADPISFHNPPHIGYATVIRTYVCPSDPRLYAPLTMPDGIRAAFATYIGVAGSTRGATYAEIDGITVLMPARGMLGQRLGTQFSEVTDGLSQTLMVGERPPPSSLQAGRWYAAIIHGPPFPGPDGTLRIPNGGMFPEDPCQPSGPGFGPGTIHNPCDRYHFWSLHSGGANFAFADGAVRFIPYQAADIMHALATISGGEQVQAP